MKLLHVLASVDPKGGGPAEAVRQLGAHLTRLGHTFEMITLDDPKQPFLKESLLTIHALGPSLGTYGYNSKLIPWLRANARNYDAVIVSGLWSYQSFGTWRALRSTDVPYYVFTHGMLDPWFKQAYPLKHLKKWLYWPWADYRVLRNARAVLFTSAEEQLLARQSFWLYRAHEKVVKYGTSPPPEDGERLRELFFAAHSRLRGRRLLLFLGRIHEKKGCELLIQSFASAVRVDPTLHLVMAGPDQTGWVDRLKKLAQDIGVGDRVSWPGMLQGDMKWGAFHSADAFVLPSHQENFGVAVVESLGCGRPVLISNKVNIWREIEAAGAGIVETDSLAGTDRLLIRWLAMGNEDRKEMGVQALRLFRRQFTVEVMAESLLEIIRDGGYQSALASVLQRGET